MNTLATELELPDNLLWPNAARISLRNLRGRVVALAFVNPASAWCRQRLAELMQWQQRHGGRLQVLAIAVPRFDCEREPGAALKQLRRSGIELPLALDREWLAWQQFGIEAWPTVLLVDAQGRVQGKAVGQDGIAELEQAAAALCAGLPEPSGIAARGLAETAPEPRLPLRFPAGLAASADRLFVADSGHHRVLECTHEGRVLRQFGTGTPDFLDGNAELAAFRHPHGLSLAREWLYVADSGNHALRRINLRSGHVETLCGNGRAGDPVEGEVRAPRDVSLYQPRAVVATDREVLLAQAGDNRIWRYDLAQSALEVLAGSGQLDVRDGAYGMAAFAQPVGLALVHQTLYVCDALGSALRSLQLHNGLVQTLVGQGPWQFGGADGPRETAQMQFPQAIALGPGAPLLWVADSGNGHLRTLRLGGGDLSTVKLPRRLHGPAGLAVTEGKVWIAETDAHSVLRYDIASGALDHVAVDE